MRGGSPPLSDGSRSARDRLERLAAHTIEIDVASTWVEFVAQAGTADPDLYLAWLRERELIDANAFVELHGYDEILLEDATPRSTTVRYDLLGPVGRGAMGMVHVARDRDLRRKVAFKTMIRHDPLLHRRFLDEVRITAQLDHPNIVPVYSIEHDDDGRPAYAMKLVRGRTLSQIVLLARDELLSPRPARRGMTRGEVGRAPTEDLQLPTRLEHFLKVCDAVAYAHSKGIVHRDLKPDNVMVGRFGEVFVMDWGIAKLLGQSERPTDEGPQLSPERTQLGAVLGTPAYMSPEQASGDSELITPASDQFALGLILYELVHLQPARRSSDLVDVLVKAATGRLDAPDRPAPPELAAIVAKATAVKPSDRYASVERLEADVRRVLRGEETEALPDTAQGRVRRWILGNQRKSAAVVLGIVLASLVSAGWALHRRAVDLTAQELHSQVREQEITVLLGQVSGRAQRIDNDLLWYEGMLQAIGDSALYALSHGTPTDGPFFHTSAFRDPATAPPGMVDSAAYGKPVSPDYPVYTAAPGVPDAIWRRDLGLMDGLRDTIRRVFLVDPRNAVPKTGRDAVAKRISQGSRSLRWAYVALERSGLMYMFPGARGWDDKYDPRTRPWYRDAVGGHGRVWSAPYVDLMGQGRLVSCLLPLYGGDGAFLGVAGIDLQFNALLDEQLKMPDLAGYRAAYLLTDQGRVMLQTTAEDDPIVIPPTEAVDPGIDFGRFANPRVVEGAVTHQPGRVVAGDDVLVWAPLEHLGWTYVVVAAAPR
jgi:serine/threonine-protein kinase